MTDYSVFHLYVITTLFLKGVQLAEIMKKFSEFNLFYKYVTQKHKILINKEKILILQKLRNK